MMVEKSEFGIKVPAFFKCENKLKNIKLNEKETETVYC